MAYLFLEYPTCGTCKKARNWLDAHGIAYAARHIVRRQPSEKELKEWVEMSGLPLKRFFNTSGMAYRKQGLKDKLPTLPEAEQLALLASDGMLVKRPLLIGENVVLVGFREEQWQTVLLVT